MVEYVFAPGSDNEIRLGDADIVQHNPVKIHTGKGDLRATVALDRRLDDAAKRQDRLDVRIDGEVKWTGFVVGVRHDVGPRYVDVGYLTLESVDHVVDDPVDLVGHGVGHVLKPEHSVVDDLLEVLDLWDVKDDVLHVAHAGHVVEHRQRDLDCVDHTRPLERPPLDSFEHVRGDDGDHAAGQGEH